jgi:hypothetical protein
MENTGVKLYKRIDKLDQISDANDDSKFHIHSYLVINLPRQRRQKCLLGILNVTTKSRLSFLILITAPKMPNLSLMPLKPSCHPQHDMRDAVLKYAIAHQDK